MFGGWGGWGKEESAGDKALAMAKEPVEKGNNKSGGGGGGGGGGGVGAAIHGFDPSALERAAKAAKELDRSKNSKEALRVIVSQEQTKQKEAESERAKF